MGARESARVADKGEGVDGRRFLHQPRRRPWRASHMASEGMPRCTAGSTGNISRGSLGVRDACALRQDDAAQGLCRGLKQIQTA